MNIVRAHKPVLENKPDNVLDLVLQVLNGLLGARLVSKRGFSHARILGRDRASKTERGQEAEASKQSGGLHVYSRIEVVSLNNAAC